MLFRQFPIHNCGIGHFSPFILSMLGYLQAMEVTVMYESTGGRSNNDEGDGSGGTVGAILAVVLLLTIIGIIVGVVISLYIRYI